MNAPDALGPNVAAPNYMLHMPNTTDIPLPDMLHISGGTFLMGSEAA
ncbi:MAG: hypothetical protein R2795_06145 [Saprospiraceae bacterium]